MLSEKKKVDGLGNVIQKLAGIYILILPPCLFSESSDISQILRNQPLVLDPSKKDHACRIDLQQALSITLTPGYPITSPGGFPNSHHEARTWRRADR